MCLRNIVQLIQSEELGYQRANASDSLGDVEPSLETGPCLEYLLHKRVLEELVEFAKVDVSQMCVLMNDHAHIAAIDTLWHADSNTSILLQSCQQCSCQTPSRTSSSYATSKVDSFVSSFDCSSL